MARKPSNQGMRNLRSAGWQAAKFTGRTADKAAVGLFRWVTTDHSGLRSALENMPSMGFLYTAKYLLMKFLFAVVGAVLTGFWIYLLIAYGIPFFFTGHF